MTYNSAQIDREQVDRFKNTLRPTLQFPTTYQQRLALAEALEELAVEFRQEDMQQAVNDAAKNQLL